MKKIISMLIVMTLVLTMAVPAFAADYYLPEGADSTNFDWYFTTKNDAATLVSYLGEATDVVIPSEIDGYPVTTISAAFDVNSKTIPCTTKITSVVIPNSVKTISGQAFRGQNTLASITIPASVEKIDTNAFMNCTGLTTVIFEENSNLTSIGESAFNTCSELTSINLPDSLLTIGTRAFWTCSKLESITIPKNVTSIGGAAFYNGSPKYITFTGDVAPTCALQGTRQTFGNSVEVKYPANGTGYTDPTWQSTYFKADTVFTPVGAAEPTPAPAVEEAVMTEDNTASDDVAAKSFTAFAKLANVDVNSEDIEYGIKFVAGDEAVTADMAKDGEIYKAEGCLETGEFSVRLVNGEGPVDYFAKPFAGFIPYLTVGGDTIFGEFVTVK